MRCNNWFGGGTDHIPKCLFPYMAYIYQHTQAVHFMNHLFSKIVKAFMYARFVAGFISSAACPGGRIIPGEGDIPGASLVERINVSKIVFYLMSAFYAKHGGNFVTAGDLINFFAVGSFCNECGIA